MNTGWDPYQLRKLLFKSLLGALNMFPAMFLLAQFFKAIVFNNSLL